MLWWQLQLDLGIKQRIQIGVVLECIYVQGVGGFISQKKEGEV
jgi:hypothetical protein